MLFAPYYSYINRVTCLQMNGGLPQIFYFAWRVEDEMSSSYFVWWLSYVMKMQVPTAKSIQASIIEYQPPWFVDFGMHFYSLLQAIGVK